MNSEAHTSWPRYGPVYRDIDGNLLVQLIFPEPVGPIEMKMVQADGPTEIKGTEGRAGDKGSKPAEETG